MCKYRSYDLITENHDMEAGDGASVEGNSEKGENGEEYIGIGGPTL